jgi:hypothetical protein
VPEEPISRDRHAIEQEIANVGVRIAQLCDSLRSGETAEQLGDVPSKLRGAADELSRLADDLAEVWPAPSAHATATPQVPAG